MVLSSLAVQEVPSSPSQEAVLLLLGQQQGEAEGEVEVHSL